MNATRKSLLITVVLFCLSLAACANHTHGSIQTQVRGQYDVSFGVIR